ncbi:dynein axonemal assembly factor 3 homolog [Pectinophora gossypiella]|uniref:dynein axonemal assembly factor 3 homolog n=1 Tax=Pectinophora gossypiella TaxID=13191 RepID=UPI00214E5FC1|nr:dynein axonemal assembly factor 3 homolog [Pectinophora gossypiella]
MFWGVSPALDLQQEYLNHGDENAYELNFLVIGGCDARHLLKTLAQAHRHTRRYMNLFVVDGCTELVARQLLLVSLALERTTRCGLLEKTRQFIEIYGNLLLRPSTSRYLIAKGRQLVGMVTNPDYMNCLLPCVSIEQMKYRERDYMENLYNFWTTGNTNQFNAVELWEHRLRMSLAMRYDCRAGVFDWDYHMRLKEVASAICVQEYKHYREHGVAFTWLETEVCRPNVSLAAGVYKCGDRYLHRGYLGDMVTSPYIGYGLDCEDKDMLKNSNGVNYKRSTDLTERNVMRMLYELEHREKFDVEAMSLDTQQNLGMVVLSNIDAKISESGPEVPLLLREDRETYIPMDYGKIHFLSLSALEHYPHKPHFQGLFHGVFVGQNMLGRVKPSVWSMARDDAIVIMETRKYVVELKREDVKAFGDQIKQAATAAQCERIQSFDPEKDDFAKFLIKRRSDSIDLST